MQKKARVFVILGTVIVLLVVTGFYINYKMDQIVMSLNRPGVLFSDSPSPLDSEADVQGSESISSEQPLGGDNTLERKQSPSYSDKVDQDDIVKAVERRVNKPIDKNDLFKAGLIIIRKLSWSEIEYLYDVGTSESISSAELKEVHRILRSRLSAEDIKVMQELGGKYGKNLDFLSADSL